MSGLRGGIFVSRPRCCGDLSLRLLLQAPGFVFIGLNQTAVAGNGLDESLVRPVTDDSTVIHVDDFIG
jgi:hypothetical protein